MLKLSKKQKVLGLTFAAVFLVVLGYLVWAVATGRIHIGAATVYPQSVSGKVYDRSGNPISSAKITNIKTGDYVMSSSTGSYSLGVPTGEVVLSYEKDGTKYPVGYSDVPAGFWAEKWIGALKNAGIVGGYPDGTFHPSEQVTRAQMAVFLARALARGDANVKAFGTQKYSDVPTSYWAYKYVDYLYNNTTIRGYSDGTFHPEEKVTRAQMAVFICKALNLDPYNKINPSFPDVPKTYWAYGYIEKVNFMGIATGYADGKFLPEQIITRDQMCVFIGRSFQDIKLTNGGYNPRIENFQMSSGKNATLDIYLTPTGQVGRVSGVVKNSSGQVINGAIVVLTLGPVSSEKYQATTDSAGKYSLFNIPAGPFSYYVIKPGSSSLYKLPYWENVIKLEAGKTTTLDLLNLR